MMSAQGLVGVNNGAAASKGELLGLQSHLLPYWQPGVDPTEAWHAYEKQVRALYAKCAPFLLPLMSASSMPAPHDCVMCCEPSTLLLMHVIDLRCTLPTVQYIVWSGHFKCNTEGKGICCSCLCLEPFGWLVPGSGREQYRCAVLNAQPA